ncbi:hypothetical protein [Rufibacter sp. LB8]|uniref:hypothetical protein n=1 Tax=Rufibacter sp. LB8 TaxID=2777781 RepID=UPI00178C6B4D|nr:hypothetical protein [Rufibacter sp. LB8]
MKKLFYLICSVLVTASACEPLEDVYDEVEAAGTTPRREMEITFTVPNYESLRGKTGVPAYVGTSYYFASEKEAGDLIPLYLNATFGHLRDGDVVDVTYNTASPSTVTERVAFTLATQEDYNMGGVTNNRMQFESMGQIETFLNAKFGAPVEGRLATLTYTWFNTNVGDGSGGVVTRTMTVPFYYTGGKWYNTYAMTPADYAAVDRSRNNAFASGDEGTLVPAAFNQIFKRNIVGAKVGDIQYGSFLVRLSASSTLMQVIPLFYDGNNWQRTTPATLSFVKKQGVWVANPVTRYTLKDADYEWIGNNETLTASKGKRDNLKQFKNFYQRFTDNVNYWKQDELVEALAALVQDRFPTATEGQRFQVTYMLHTGPTGPASVILVKENGKFVVPAN